VETYSSVDVLLQDQQQQGYILSLCNQNQVKQIPEIMPTTGAYYNELSRTTGIEEGIDNEEIIYENMPDLIDQVSKEILVDELQKSKSQIGLNTRVLQLD
jgi:hypothetical protein